MGKVSRKSSLILFAMNFDGVTLRSILCNAQWSEWGQLLQWNREHFRTSICVA